MTSPVAEAIRLLRAMSADMASGEDFSSASSIANAADALATYFREPSAEEVERLAERANDTASDTRGRRYLSWKNHTPGQREQVCGYVRAVLRAIGGSEPT